MNVNPRRIAWVVLVLNVGPVIGACDRTGSQGQETSGMASKKEMADGDFWQLVSLLDWKKTGDDDAVIAPLVLALAKRSEDNIKAFEDVLAGKLFALDGEAFARNIGDGAYVSKDAFFSVDAFLYARCAVVANGAEYFAKVLNNPACMPRDLEFEALLSVAAKAYHAKTGRQFDYTPKVDYETFANKARWK